MFACSTDAYGGLIELYDPYIKFFYSIGILSRSATACFCQQLPSMDIGQDGHRGHHVLSLVATVFDRDQGDVVILLQNMEGKVVRANVKISYHAITESVT